MKRDKHVHKYEFINNVWGCSLFGCPHWLPKNWQNGLPIGRLSLCHKCNKEFYIDPITLQKSQGNLIVKPVCNECETDINKILARQYVE